VYADRQIQKLREIVCLLKPPSKVTLSAELIMIDFFMVLGYPLVKYYREEVISMKIQFL
jgi:hypothetical protein